jgi:predicted CXXCH cytochrome family protein
MASNKKIKFALVAVFALVLASWALSGSFGTVRGDATADEFPAPAAVPDKKDAGYVGSETCKACHEDQFNNFAHTKHSKLADSPSWKDKVTGCETCHGPGQAHVENGGDKTKIKSFKDLSAKEISDSCLACHAGKESHNNFRRGEHWRNDVGCTECHSPHGEPAKDLAPGSMTFVGAAHQDRNTQHPVAMLRMNEQQLCLSCHNEKKAEFNKPFHHKVPEGTMNCSDCHNAHGGFETKQAKLANGADAACIKCHSNKQGPFVFEHGPVKTEGCSACHTPHGSNNPKMLKRASVRQLCLECHTGIQEELSPQAPSLHNQAQIKYQQCTVCHSAIHGSNSSNVLFR